MITAHAQMKRDLRDAAATYLHAITDHERSHEDRIRLAVRLAKRAVELHMFEKGRRFAKREARR